MLFGRSEFIPEGAGISPDTPRKKGLARLVEIMSRDLDGIFLSGSLALLACVPAAALVGIAVWMAAVSAGRLLYRLAGRPGADRPLRHHPPGPAG